MEEISYIEQNGEKYYLKDKAGRELLAGKQAKLKAGEGISISEDGTISAVGASGFGNFKEVIIKDCLLSNYSGMDHLFDFHLLYAGNPALIKEEIYRTDDSGGFIESYLEHSNIQLSCWGYDHSKEFVYDYFKDLPATEDKYLILIPLYAEITQGGSNDGDGHYIPTGAKTYFYKNANNAWYEGQESGGAILLEKRDGEEGLYLYCFDESTYQYCYKADLKYLTKAILGE